MPGKHTTAALPALGALCLVMAVGEALRWGGSAGLHWWADGGWTLAGGLGLGACLCTARRTRGNARLVWILFTLACGSWLVGQLFWDYYDLGAGFPPSPAPDDVGYLLFSPLFIAGFLGIGTGRRLTRVLLACDVGVAACAFAVLFTTIFWNDFLHSPLSPAAQATVTLYPVLYATLGVTVLLLPLRRAWQSPSLRWLLLGLGAQVIAFILWAPPLLSGTWSEGTPIDTLWMAGMLLIAASARSFKEFPAADAEAQAHGGVVLLPLALSCAAVVRLMWLFVSTAVPDDVERDLAALVLGFVLLTALRLGLTLHYSRDLYRQALDTADAWQESKEWFRILSENATELVSVVDREGRYTYVSPSHQPILGYDPAQLLGTSFRDLIHPDDLAATDTRWASSPVDATAVHRGEARIRHADGSWRWVDGVGRHALENPAIGGVIFNARDITERKRAEEELRHQALHDNLTGLPNWTLLRDRLGRALLVAQDDHSPLALLLLDLDRFKEINDTFGHHHGDALLRQVAERLQGSLRPIDTVARLGGDEFAVLLPGAGEAGALAAAGRISALLDVPIDVEGQCLHVGASVGIALSPEHGLDAQTLHRCAEVAMYAAKRGGHRQVVYVPTEDGNTPDRLVLIEELRQAIARGDLLLHYQPKVDMATARVAAVEALVRWPHPQRGLVRPDVFIPLAEQTGLIAPLTLWVLRAALEQCQAWLQMGLHLPVAVNLSTVTLHDPELPATIERLLAQHAVPATALRIEVTESTLMADLDRTQRVLARLAALGVGISVDDYGTGYSSLAYLKRLPVDEIKIDMAFVRHMAEDEADAAIVASTIGLGHCLGLHVVAEGVETQDAWERLRGMGCDTAQGYYLSRPLPAPDLEQWLREASQAVA